MEYLLIFALAALLFPDGRRKLSEKAAEHLFEELVKRLRRRD